jgi:hypothetical protein
MGWTAGVRFLARTRDYSLSHRFRISSGAHPVSYLIGTGVLFSGAKRPGREGDHSPSSSAEVKNGGAILPLPICLHGVVLN